MPTTYYAAVQVAGEVEVVDDPADLAALLGVQLDDLEPPDGLRDAIAHAQKFPAMRGLRLRIDAERVKAKFKYGGNTDEAHRRRAAEQLATRNGPGDAAARKRIG